MKGGREWEQFGNDAPAWESQAEHLARLARFLARHCNAFSSARKAVPDLGPPAMSAALLLYAFSVECYFKAQWLRRGRVLVKGGRYRGIPKVNNHDLCALADACAFALSELEREMLSRLTVFGVIGRYPVHSTPAQESAGRYWTVIDRQALTEMLSRIERTSGKGKARRKR